MSGQIRTVDDHEVVRNGIRSLLSSRPDWKIFGEAEDGVDAIEKAESLRPDVVLMDISMPRMDGLDATRAIRRELPHSKVVIVSQNDAAIARRQAAEVDAASYISKSNLPLDLIATLDRLTNGSSAKATPKFLQESQTNIHRHSESKNATITLGREERAVTLKVQDQGKGISQEKLAKIQSQGSSVGIRGMRERIRQFGGAMKIESKVQAPRFRFVSRCRKPSLPSRKA